MGEWRKVETQAPEGATADHTAYEWQFGGEIDGVFVAAVTKAGGYVDSLVAAGKQAQADEQKNSQASASSSATSSEGGGSGEAGAA